MTTENNNSAKLYAEDLAARFQFQHINRLQKIITEGRSSAAAQRLTQDEPLKNTVLWEKAATHLATIVDELAELSDDPAFFEELIQVGIDPELHTLIARLTDLRAILVGPHEKPGSTISPIRHWVFELAKYWEDEKGIPITQYFGPAGNDGVKRPAKDGSSSQFVFEVIERYEPRFAKGVHHALCAYIDHTRGT